MDVPVLGYASVARYELVCGCDNFLFYDTLDCLEFINVLSQTKCYESHVDVHTQ